MLEIWACSSPSSPRKPVDPWSQIKGKRFTYLGIDKKNSTHMKFKDYMEEAYEYSMEMIRNQIDAGYETDFFPDFFDEANRTTVKEIFQRMDTVVGKRSRKYKLKKNKTIWLFQWDIGGLCGDPNSLCYSGTVLAEDPDGKDPLKVGDMMLHCCLLPSRMVPQNVPDLDIAQIGNTASDKMATMAATLVHEYM